MHEYPHCKQDSITSLQKLCSVAFMPASCPHCHGYSYLQMVHGLKALITWIILSWVFIGIALHQRMTMYLIGTIPAMMFAVDKCMLKAPMRAIILRK